MTAALDEAIRKLGGAGSVVRDSLQVVAPAGPDPDDSERSLVRALRYVAADDIPDVDEPFDDELIEGTIGRAAMAVLYGDSNSGKTFLGIDLAASICRRTDWMNRPVAGGLVVYLATESPASVRMRLRAYRRHFGAGVPGFFVVESPINLFDGKADTTAVLALIDQLEREHGEKVVLIIGDTLARLSSGANENSGEDMGIVVRNGDAIRSATGATFLWIHHCGKDQAKGMRGWSGLRAAIDTEIEISADEATGVRTAEITKQRDLPGKGQRIGFRLQPVDLGHNVWGTVRSSCVVVPADAPTKQPRGKRESKIEGAITEFLRTRGTGCARGALVKHFEGHYIRSSVYREVAKMIEAGVLIESAGVIALPGKPGVNA